MRMPMSSKRLRLLVVAFCTAALPSAAAEPYSVLGRCAQREFLTIAAAGDIIFQPELEVKLNSEGISYRMLWRPLEEVINAADLAYANIEGPVAGADATSTWRAAWGGEASSRPRLDFN